MNIILKSFDGTVFERSQVEHALRGMDIGTCITVANAEKWKPNIPARSHIWVDANKQRIGDYTGMDWNAIIPLDADLIERMRGSEMIVMTMMGRHLQQMPQYLVNGDIPFHARRRYYYEHLRYWNHMLEKHRIDVVLMNHKPHQGYDDVLYKLCRSKGIPAFYLTRTYTVAGCFITSDWEDPSPELRRRHEELERKYADEGMPVPLSPDYEHIFRFYRDPHPVPLYLPKLDRLKQHNAASARIARAAKVLRRDPGRFFSSILSSVFWARKRRERRIMKLYEQLAQEPDLSLPYVYVPLHLQPESSTLPLAGPFEDQLLVVQLLAAHLPHGWRLYVKENPEQDERWRSEEFYNTLATIPSVTIVPRKTGTFELIDRARAVATGTGTVAFEAALRCKPTLMFGRFLWQYAPGVLPVRTSEDCKQALQMIEQGKSKHTEHAARVFLKAMEETATPYPGSRRSPIHTPEEETPEREEEKARMVGALLRRHIEAALEKGS